MQAVSQPPRTFEELQLWKVFVKAYTGDLWQVIHRWIKKEGNPFSIPTQELEEEKEQRRFFQMALAYVIEKQ